MPAFVLQGQTSSGWWTVRALRTVDQLVTAHKRYAGNAKWRIVWLEDCPNYK